MFEYGGKIVGKFLDVVNEEIIDRSGLGKLKERMPPEDFEDLLVVLKDHKISGGAICRALNRNGYEISISALNVIRRKL